MLDRIFLWFGGVICKFRGHAEQDSRTASFTEYGFTIYQCPRCGKVATEKKLRDMTEDDFNEIFDA